MGTTTPPTTGTTTPTTTTATTTKTTTTAATTTQATPVFVDEVPEDAEIPLAPLIDNNGYAGDKETLCRNTPKIVTDASTLLHNNLGGRGPRFNDPEELRFRQSAELGFDLVVKVDTTVNDFKTVDMAKAEADKAEGKICKPTSSYCNILGVWGMFGNINLKGTSDFVFSFENSETGEPVELPSVMFTWFDLDGTEETKEKVTTCDSDLAYVTAMTYLELADPAEQNGCVKVVSAPRGVVNPQDYHGMSNAQKAVSAVTQFSHKSSFSVQMRIGTETKDKNRNILFMAQPTFACEEFEVPEVPLPVEEDRPVLMR